MSSEYCGPLPISSKLNNSRYNEVYDLSVDSMDNLAKEGKIVRIILLKHLIFIFLRHQAFLQSKNPAKQVLQIGRIAVL
uniref:Uncharacterized protein n=1 Tax=Meloidogyne enterolobii TaxID=390850 RepID=A0A6V7X7N7_MELEN|nr:unnamed protein product [Meloidogyne enterolobii]